MEQAHPVHGRRTSSGGRVRDLQSGHRRFASRYDSAAWSPAYTLVVKPLENVSVYANYIEGLQMGTIVGTTFQNGSGLPPSSPSSSEMGVKVDWGRFTTTVTAYDISQPAQITIPNTPFPIFSIDGENRNRGVELNTFGELTPGWRLLGGVAFMDARRGRLRTAPMTASGRSAFPMCRSASAPNGIRLSSPA